MSDTSLILFFSTIPIILILVFVYNRDNKKEPISLLLGLFLSGIISCFLVIEISKFLSNYLDFMNLSVKSMDTIELLLYSFIGVALIEELCKWIMIYIFGYHSKKFDELFDIIVYSVFVSLGFAFFENIIYIFYNGNLQVALLRAISAIPAHACDAIFMGYYLSVAKKNNHKNKKGQEIKYLIISIFIPTILHGIYDFCLMSNQMILVYVFIAFVLILYIISIDRLRQMSDNNKKLDYKNKFCENCGTKVTGDFCDKCGKKQD